MGMKEEEIVEKKNEEEKISKQLMRGSIRANLSIIKLGNSHRMQD